MFSTRHADASKFKKDNSLEKRKAEASKIRSKYPDRIPIICERAERNDVPALDKTKFLVSNDLSIAQFHAVVRKRIQLPAEKAIFLFIRNTLPPTAANLAQLYEEYKDEDGFLYITYSGENSFGAQ